MQDVMVVMKECLLVSFVLRVCDHDVSWPLDGFRRQWLWHIDGATRRRDGLAITRIQRYAHYSIIRSHSR